MASEVTREELLARARSLGPTLAERAAKTEELRRLPEETYQAFKDVGLLRVFVPREFGGYELEFGTVIETARESYARALLGIPTEDPVF